MCRLVRSSRKPKSGEEGKCKLHAVNLGHMVERPQASSEASPRVPDSRIPARYKSMFTYYYLCTAREHSHKQWWQQCALACIFFVGLFCGIESTLKETQLLESNEIVRCHLSACLKPSHSDQNQGPNHIIYCMYMWPAAICDVHCLTG